MIDYRTLRPPRLPKWMRDLGASSLGIPNADVVRAGFCPGCKEALDACECDEPEGLELDFEDPGR